MNLPHKWPGRKALYIIQAQMRVLGVPDMPCPPKGIGQYYRLYRDLSRKQQKEAWASFRTFVLFYMETQQGKDE